MNGNFNLAGEDRSADDSSQLRVLVVDDEPLNLKIIAKHLASMGLNVHR